MGRGGPSAANLLLAGRDRRDLVSLIHARQAIAAAQRRRRTISLGVAFSALVHLGVMVWLAASLRPGYGPDDRSIGMSVGPVAEESVNLTDASDQTVQDTATDVTIDAPVARSLETSAIAGTTQIAAATAAAPSLGGAGNASSTGGGAGGSGTSFFGIRSSGSRFAYIVDRSGSMQENGRWDYARAELIRSLRQLPDHALFHVVLYSSGIDSPPQQRQWLPARARMVRSIERWLEGIPASGGTQPEQAFRQAFGLPRRPDVIFFLTDGEIPESTAALVRELNSLGKPVVVNAIAFGGAAAQDILREIAGDSGGRFTPFALPRLP